MTDTVVVGMDEAQDRLPELIEMVRNGATVSISKSGAVAAQLTPPEEETTLLDGPQLAALLESMIQERGSSGRSTAEIEEDIRIERAAWD